ncbi:hypothetical protein VTN77DRAFT_1524 [Rasamsonia byssochlamydoides]|uniref:uncharacterized protein n=1 Tax=Rasamsonia byssochlamydoides TaxID=89139 RepID=UPI00374287C0
MSGESKDSQHVVIPLNENWHFKEAADDTWLPVSQFPTNIHLDLLYHKKIPDPFWGQNESEVQWVGEKVWLYRTEFDSPATIPKDHKVVLSFEGLDTFATVVLNGTEILKSDNMFIPRRVTVTDKINAGSKNTLEITFDSAWIVGKKLQEQFPDHKWGCWNGDASRLVVRKAQYHYGWDWGPTLLTAGPWRPVYLEIYSSRIEDLYFTTKVADSLDSAQIVAKADVEGTGSSVTFELSLDGQTVQTAAAEVADGHAETVLHVEKPQLWYPATYGKQPLYQLKATLHQDGRELDVLSKRLGIRKAVLVQRAVKDAPGSSFFFEINNIPVFCGGSNWIPADCFIPRITKERYRSWLKLVRDGNQIMMRVWGGGIYEEDAFYDAADELGILLWQDFMFACGNYPASIPAFRELVKEEAIANVKRLRHHPSIAIYAGNNEDYQYQESENLEYDPDNKDPDSWLKTNFPARYIYEKILVDVTKELVPDTYYHFGSPYGGKDTRDATVGDIHQWNVWHGSQERYQMFDKLSGRFVSEFGMEAFPNIKTIESFTTPEERYAQSSTMDFHNKATGHEKRLAGYLAENFDFSTRPLKQYIYITQLMQAECLSAAYRYWRRNWKGPGKEYTSGALVWQINDCWPVISWSIIDHTLRPKLAYHAVKQSLAPLTIGIKREVHYSHPKDKYTRVYISREHRVYVWGSNFLLHKVDATLHVKAFDVVDGKKIYDRDHGRVTLEANRSTELGHFQLPMGENNKVDDDPNRVVVAVYLLDSDGKRLARFISWPDVLKYVKLQNPKRLTVETSENSVSVSADVPVKGVTLEKDGVEFEDNLFDLVPEDTVSVKARGLRPGQDDVTVHFYLPGREGE